MASERDDDAPVGTTPRALLASTPDLAPIPREITGWLRETPSAVVLHLDCGHDRHVRHRPPLAENPWVQHDDACAERIGARIECLRCSQRELPEAARVHRRTRDFTEETIPAGLRASHDTKAGVWGRVNVDAGHLWVCFEGEPEVEAPAGPGAVVVIPPQCPHHVRLGGPVRFHVEFLRVDDTTAADTVDGSGGDTA